MSWTKRLFDVAISGVGLCLLAPFLTIIALVIKVGDGGPVFFRQHRVGYKGRIFEIWKFRTMMVDADRHGGVLTIGDDRRVTPAGRWLRAVKLDELPQLFNVLRGEMSLVGPRPEVPRYVSMYTDEQRRVLDIYPGITDVASVRFSRESELLGAASDPERVYIQEIMPEKIRLNLEYAASATVWRDFKVLLGTALHLVRVNH